jgi:hypothetical protein
MMDFLSNYGLDLAVIAAIVVGGQAIKRYVRGAKRWMPWIVVGLGIAAGAALARPWTWQEWLLKALKYGLGALGAYAVAKPLRRAR